MVALYGELWIVCTQTPELGQEVECLVPHINDDSNTGKSDMFFKRHKLRAQSKIFLGMPLTEF